MTKASRILALSCAALIGVGVANIDVKIKPTRVVKVPETRTVTKTVPKLGFKPIGVVTRDECRSIKRGAYVGDLVYRYGWPHGSNAIIDFFQYPIASNHDDTCMVDFFDAHVQNVTMDLTNGEQWSMNDA